MSVATHSSKSRLSITATKYLACSNFIMIGALSLADSVVNQNLVWRDAIILFVLSLPLIINKRLFYLGYGFLAALVSLPCTIIYAFSNYPIKSDTSLAFYFLGLVIFLLAVICSIALIHVGTFSKVPNRFRLVGDGEIRFEEEN